MGKRILTTKRTFIDEIDTADAPFMFELMRTPGWIKFIGDRGLNSISEVETYLEDGVLKNRLEFGFGYYVARSKDAENLGVAGFLKRDYLENADYGFAFMPKFANKGFAYEVSEALLDYAKSEIGFQVLDAVTMHINTSSQKLLEKLGFVCLGDKKVPDDPNPLFLYRLQIKD